MNNITNDIIILLAYAIENSHNSIEACRYYNLAKDYVNEITKNNSEEARLEIMQAQIYPLADYIIQNF